MGFPNSRRCLTSLNPNATNRSGNPSTRGSLTDVGERPVGLKGIAGTVAARVCPNVFEHSDFNLTQPDIEDRSVSSFNSGKRNPRSFGG
jgi:hypothetical protein